MSETDLIPFDRSESEVAFLATFPHYLPDPCPHCGSALLVPMGLDGSLGPQCWDCGLPPLRDVAGDHHPLGAGVIMLTEIHRDCGGEMTVDDYADITMVRVKECERCGSSGTTKTIYGQVGIDLDVLSILPSTDGINDKDRSTAP